jgi:clan AA aspartic protease
LYEVKGNVTPALDACVGFRLASGEEFEAVIDTGFNGALVLPEEVARELALPVVNYIECSLAGDVAHEADVAVASIEWFGEIREVQVVVMPAGYLIGTQLLAGTRLTIDYEERAVLIEKKSS